MKCIEDENENARNDNIIGRTFNTEVYTKVYLLEKSLVNVNIFLDKTKERIFVVNTRTREATTKMEKAIKQSDKRLIKIEELIGDSSNLRDQLMSEQKANITLEKKLKILVKMM